MKIMLVGTDNLFGLWLGFFREHIITFVSLIVQLPLTMAMNWRLGCLLVELVVIFGVVSALVIRQGSLARRERERRLEGPSRPPAERQSGPRCAVRLEPDAQRAPSAAPAQEPAKAGGRRTRLG
jgi:hypothetical protein